MSVFKEENASCQSYSKSYPLCQSSSLKVVYNVRVQRSAPPYQGSSKSYFSSRSCSKLMEYKECNTVGDDVRIRRCQIRLAVSFGMMAHPPKHWNLVVCHCEQRVQNVKCRPLRLLLPQTLYFNINTAADSANLLSATSNIGLL